MIGNFIQKIREENQLSQKLIASKLGLSRPTYIAIEKGEREITIKEARSIAKLFNITLEQLINEQEPSQQVVVERSRDKNYPKTDCLRISIPQKNFEKFREVLLYILSKVGAKPNVGETVLYKLLYFIDFDYYEKYEEQLIGATYIKNHFGPTPVEFKELIKNMVKDGEIELVKSQYFQHEQKKYLAVREPDLSKSISAQELQHINEVLARLSDKNATELSDYSHQDVPWIVTEDGKPIDYESVFYRTPKTSVRNYGEDQI
jgi:transcriptional regulator with XRE-family HTH domain